MASLASVSSFSGVKVQSLKAPATRSISTSRPATVVCSAGNPWEKVGKALVATGAGLLIATSATAATVQLGTDTGGLEFVPSTIKVKKGEAITFSNNKAFPHNIIFDEDTIPAGVTADSLSKEEYLNGPGESYTVTLTVPGEYGIYCEPHVGAGMSAKITVE